MSIRTKFALLIGLALIAISVIIYFVNDGSPIERHRFKKEVLEYIKERFSEKMIVDKVYFSFESGSYWAIAYPENNKGVRFEISGELHHGLSDDYLIKSWNYDVNKELDPFIKKTYSKKDWGRIVIGYSTKMLLKYNKSPIVRAPKYDEVKQDLKEGTSIHITLQRDYNNKQTEIEYAKIFKVIQFIKENQYTFEKVEFNFFKDIKSDLVTFTFISFDNINSQDDIAKFQDK